MLFSEGGRLVPAKKRSIDSSRNRPLSTLSMIVMISVRKAYQILSSIGHLLQSPYPFFYWRMGAEKGENSFAAKGVDDE